MRILVLTSERRWTDALQALFAGGHDLIAWPPNEVNRNERLMGAIDACFVADREIGAATVSTIKSVHAISKAPLFALTDVARPEWEEAAILAGAQHVFTYPLRARLIEAAMLRNASLPGSGSLSPFPISTSSNPPVPPIVNGEVLALLRDFSRLLVHAVDGPLFMGEYLRKLREVLRCSRLILYLSDISSSDKKLKCTFATGVDPRPFDAIRLNPADGVARLLAQRGSVIQRVRLRDHLPMEAAAGRELDVFGVELAVPLNARDGMVGVLLVGSRIAGTDYTEIELTLLFHLMEELGAAVRNAELHADLLRERGMFSAVLRAVPIGCLVLNQSHRVIHANVAMREYLGVNADGVVTFEHLPQAWATAAYGVLQARKTEAQLETSHDVAGERRRLRLKVTPLEPVDGHAERAVLLTITDISEEARARADGETAVVQNLLQRAGEQLSNEFRNALTPLDTMVQLSREGMRSGPELSELTSLLGDAMHRLRRRVDDLAYLTRAAIMPEPTTVQGLLAAARRRLESWIGDKEMKTVRWPATIPNLGITVDENAVALAIAELVVNAIEASVGQPVEVSLQVQGESLSLRVRNSGAWSPPHDSSGFTHRPFVTSKPMGVGLGLEVASRVAEYHGGRLALGPLSQDVVEATLRIPLKFELPLRPQ
jgi:signal transduction histidine kinase